MVGEKGYAGRLLDVFFTCVRSGYVEEWAGWANRCRHEELRVLRLALMRL
jgi:hypothetical protein